MRHPLHPFAFLALLLAARAEATDVFDVNDAAFQGHVVVDLPPAGISTTDSTATFTQDGVTFTLTNVDGSPLDPSGAGTEIWVGSGDGFTLSASPGVPAMGFFAAGVDGCPGAVFTGASGTEPVVLFPCSGSPAFFGAAGVGDIGGAVVELGGNYFTVDSLVFVPPGFVPTQTADLSIGKTESGLARTVAGSGAVLDYVVTVDNAGPNPAADVVVTDLLPNLPAYGSGSTSGAGTLYEIDADLDLRVDYLLLQEPDLANGGSVDVSFDMTTPGRDAFSCHSRILNVALVSSDALDPDLTDNVAIATTFFDLAPVLDDPEICGNGIDDDCNGRTDCADNCNCRPTLPPLSGGDVTCFGGLSEALIELGLPPDTCTSGGPDGGNDAGNHACTVPRGACGGVTVPAFCCDAATWSNPGFNGNLSSCDVGVPGCVPRDPNWKDADPGVNLWGYGYTAAGETITYAIHYENVGDADAHDVLVIDVLDEDLDPSSLAIDDGGTYDPATATITWADPVVPPHTPREVGFSAKVRADATPGVRVRNVATVVFPDAVPPTRIDTNFVEHAIPSPDLDLVPVLSVLECVETEPGSGLWNVRLVNDGPGFAYDVTATIRDAPSGVALTDAEATFSHPDDDETARTVIPFATTTSGDTVAFTGARAVDPCATFDWRITWDDLAGHVTTVDIAADEPPDEGDDTPDDDPGGCACGACSTGAVPPAPLPTALLLLGASAWVRRVRRWR